MATGRDLAAFYRALAELLRAGILVDAAVGSGAHLLPEAHAAAGFIAAGEPMSDAFARFPRVFPADHVRLIRLAERSGSVDTMLGDLADYAAEMLRARGALLSGLALPAAIVHVGALVLPLPGLVLGGSLGGYVATVVSTLILPWALAGSVFAFVRYGSAGALDGVLSRLPYVADTWRDLEYWRTTTALRLLSRTHLGVPEMLRFSAEGCRHVPLASALRRAADAAERHGEPASVSLRTAGVLPPDVLALWQNGEQTGRLDATFDRLAARFADSFQRRVQALSQWLPRLAYFLVLFYFGVKVILLAKAQAGGLNGF